VINNPVHPISQHGHIRNSLNSCRRQRNYRINRWHPLHHVLPLEELATSGQKHKIDYTQSHTQPRSMYIKGCLPKSRATCRTHGEGYLVWLLSYSWRGHGNSSNTPSWRVEQPLLYCLGFETWLLPKGRHREGEGDIMDGYFCTAPSPKVWQQKMAPKQSR
jgi:hypothetical protein